MPKYVNDPAIIRGYTGTDAEAWQFVCLEMKWSEAESPADFRRVRCGITPPVWPPNSGNVFGIHSGEEWGFPIYGVTLAPIRGGSFGPVAVAGVVPVELENDPESTHFGPYVRPRLSISSPLVRDLVGWKSFGEQLVTLAPDVIRLFTYINLNEFHMPTYVGVVQSVAHVDEHEVGTTVQLAGGTSITAKWAGMTDWTVRPIVPHVGDTVTIRYVLKEDLWVAQG
jgi:hypothetical protein